tara:strand:- start:2119 stop:2253 length:135 start_codon:yes stop_codon:yes gene_type:complete
MELIKNRIWEEYMTITGGDFSQWYEGMSPIELSVFAKKMFDERQ